MLAGFNERLLLIFPSLTSFFQSLPLWMYCFGVLFHSSNDCCCYLWLSAYHRLTKSGYQLTESTSSSSRVFCSDLLASLKHVNIQNKPDLPWFLSNKKISILYICTDFFFFASIMKHWDLKRQKSTCCCFYILGHIWKQSNTISPKHDYFMEISNSLVENRKSVLFI